MSLWGSIFSGLLKILSGSPRIPGVAGRIERAMRRKGYRVDLGEGELNIVYVEDTDIDGARTLRSPLGFNDLCVVFGRKGVVGQWICTTGPGTYYTKTHVINPKGAARIQLGQHRAWQVGMHRGNHEALVQTGGPVTVCRDLNKDYSREGDKLDTGYFGINQHGTGGADAALNDIGPHSAGCLVRPRMADHRNFMKTVKLDRRYIANHRFVFTSTILSAKDI